jgi:hypothetical protein
LLTWIKSAKHSLAIVLSEPVVTALLKFADGQELRFVERDSVTNSSFMESRAIAVCKFHLLFRFVLITALIVGELVNMLQNGLDRLTTPMKFWMVALPSSGCS